MLEHRCVRTRFGVIQAAATLGYYRKRLNQAEESAAKCLSQMQNNVANVRFELTITITNNGNPTLWNKF